jgi:hypothetical protein
MMFADPAPTAVTTPVGDTVATLGRSEIHSPGVTVDVEPLALVAVAVAVVVLPASKVETPRVTVRDAGTGLGFDGLL